MSILNNRRNKLLLSLKSLNKHAVMKSHEDGSGGDNEFMHACTIIIFLLIRLLYLSIHLINYLFQLIQFYSVFVNFINLIAMFSLTACCM